MKSKYFAILIVILNLLVFACNQKKENAQNTIAQQSEKTTTVKILEVKERKIAETLQVQGNIQTKESVLVSARLDGILEKLYVDEGAKVIKNKTKLFKIETENLENNHKIQKHNLEMAKYKLAEAQANYERIKSENEKITIDYERSKRLLEKNVITKDMFEQIETRYKQSLAALKQSNVLIKLSEEAINQAAAALEISAKKLTDAEVYAPIDGYISKKFQKEGETLRFGMPIFQIDDIYNLEVCAFLPAEHYSKIIIGKTKIDVNINDLTLSKVITYKSPTINPQLRVFEIRAAIANENQKIAIGSLAQVIVYLSEEREAITAPKSAILNEHSKKIVFTADNNIAKKIEVQTGLEINGNVEIISGLKKSDKIIIEGQSQLKENDKIKIIE